MRHRTRLLLISLPQPHMPAFAEIKHVRREGLRLDRTIINTLSRRRSRIASRTRAPRRRAAATGPRRALSQWDNTSARGRHIFLFGVSVATRERGTSSRKHRRCQRLRSLQLNGLAPPRTSLAENCQYARRALMPSHTNRHITLLAPPKCGEAVGGKQDGAGKVRKAESVDSGCARSPARSYVAAAGFPVGTRRRTRFLYRDLRS